MTHDTPSIDRRMLILSGAALAGCGLAGRAAAESPLTGPLADVPLVP